MRFTLLSLILTTAALGAHRPALRSNGGMVAADNATASRIGADILEAGGDAVDAAVATALALGVLHPFASGLGGGGFAVVFRADTRRRYALDFREVAPASATRDMYLDAQGAPIPHASTRGPRAAGVPGELAGLFELHRRHGKLPWAQVVAPALRLAREGFATPPLLHERATAKRAELSTRPRLARIYLPAGAPLSEGARVRRPDLARSLARVAAEGAATFYRGALARDLAAAIQAAGGAITAQDLARYAVKERAVVEIQWRGYTVISMPPPSSGGAVIALALRAIEGVDLKALGHNSSAYLHRLTEALKHGFADRARLMGDPDFTPVPLAEIIGDAARDRVIAAFQPDHTLPRSAYGGRYTLPTDGGTTHLSVVDAAGNAVALTSTINTSFGSLFVAGDTGVLLNDEMDDFVMKPGVPNAYGLVGREANQIAPGKRPLSSMSPTVVLKEGQVALVVGGSGGPTIITATLQVLLNALVFHMDPRAAVEVPRMHHQWVPDQLKVEQEIPQDVVEGLRRRGHTVKRWSRWTAVQVIERADGILRGASDPSKGGAPAAAPRP